MRDADRLVRCLIIALACGTVVLVSKILDLPETAISACLVIFAARPEVIEALGVSVGLVVAAFTAIALVIVIIMATAGTPVLRIPTMFIIAFCAMYLAHATPGGIIVATIGMAMFFVLSLLDDVAYPDLLLRGIFWLLTVIFVPMAVLFVISALFTQSARTRLTNAMNKRFVAISQATNARSDKSFAACRDLLINDAEEITKLRRLAAKTGQIDTVSARRAATLEAATARLLADCAGRRPPMNTTGSQISEMLRSDKWSNETIDEAEQPEADSATIDTSTGRDKAQESIRFAIKSCVAIAICYTVFVLCDWWAIHTIIVTPFLISLGSTGETLHKASLRITGFALGAIFTIFCLFTVIPNLQSIAGLVVLTMLVTLPAAWVATGSERYSYAGLQFAFVFYFSVLNSSGPTIDFETAWGRALGILLANLIVATVFLSLWPTSASTSVGEQLKRVSDALAAARKARSLAQNGFWLNRAAAALREAQDSVAVLRFDPAAKSVQAAFEKETARLNAQLFASLQANTRREVS